MQFLLFYTREIFQSQSQLPPNGEHQHHTQIIGKQGKRERMENIDKINIVTNKLFEESGMEIPSIITGINKNPMLNNKIYTLNEITTLLENT